MIPRRALFVLTCLCAGCGSCDQTPQANTPGAPAEPETGVVVGTVRLAEGAELPAYPLDTTARPAPPEGCTPPRQRDGQPVRLGEGRGLAGVLVAAAEFSRAPSHQPVAHRVAIRNCRLEPQLVAATRGDRIELVNETDYPYMPTLGPGGLLQALLHGETRELPLDTGRIHVLGCAFLAPCGRTDVIVLSHDVFAVTGGGGRFRLERVPTGEPLEIHAWHPLFEEASATVTVRSGEEPTRVDLVLGPAPSRPEPPPPEPSEGPAEDHPDELF